MANKISKTKAQWLKNSNLIPIEIQDIKRDLELSELNLIRTMDVWFGHSFISLNY